MRRSPSRSSTTLVAHFPYASSRVGDRSTLEGIALLCLLCKNRILQPTPSFVEVYIDATASSSVRRGCVAFENVKLVDRARWQSARFKQKSIYLDTVFRKKEVYTKWSRYLQNRHRTFNFTYTPPTIAIFRQHLNTINQYIVKGAPEQLAKMMPPEETPPPPEETTPTAATTPPEETPPPPPAAEETPAPLPAEETPPPPPPAEETPPPPAEETPAPPPAEETPAPKK